MSDYSRRLGFALMITGPFSISKPLRIPSNLLGSVSIVFYCSRLEVLELPLPRSRSEVINVTKVHVFDWMNHQF